MSEDPRNRFRFLTGLFLDQAVFRDGYDNKVSVAWREIASLRITSGRIVVCDPFVLADKPFQRTVYPGRYPVALGIARFPSGDERVACTIVRFANGPSVAWKLAGRDNKEASIARSAQHSVDFGDSCHLDEQAWLMRSSANRDLLTGSMNLNVRHTSTPGLGQTLCSIRQRAPMLSSSHLDSAMAHIALIGVAQRMGVPSVLSSISKSYTQRDLPIYKGDASADREQMIVPRRD
jgi:Protein of unknown function (DUF4241)